MSLDLLKIITDLLPRPAHCRPSPRGCPAFSACEIGESSSSAAPMIPPRPGGIILSGDAFGHGSSATVVSCLNCQSTRWERRTMTALRSSPVQRKEIRALRQEIQQRTGKTPEQLYEERERRVRDSIFLKQPDRLPLFIFPDPCAHYHVRQSAAYYDPGAWRQVIHVQEAFRHLLLADSQEDDAGGHQARLCAYAGF